MFKGRIETTEKRRKAGELVTLLDEPYLAVLFNYLPSSPSAPAVGAMSVVVTVAYIAAVVELSLSKITAFQSTISGHLFRKKNSRSKRIIHTKTVSTYSLSPYLAFSSSIPLIQVILTSIRTTKKHTIFCHFLFTRLFWLVEKPKSNA
jgi:hypothetical protein